MIIQSCESDYELYYQESQILVTLGSWYIDLNYYLLNGLIPPDLDVRICYLLDMASLVMHVPHLSKNDLRLSSKVGSMRDFVGGYHHDSSLVFGSQMLQCIRFINTIHTRGASMSLTIKRERKQEPWVVRCNGNNAESSDKSDNAPNNRSFRQSSFGSTRLAKVIHEVQKKLTEKFKELQKNFPMKVLCLLLGFYCASVIATSIGQTGDWDILSAGLAVAVVEGIGALMYRAYPLIERLQSLVTMVNYWKAGLSLGLFLDAFKYEIDVISMLVDSFYYEIDLFSMFL